MHLSVESHEVIFGDGCSVKRSFQLDDAVLHPFLIDFFRLLYTVDTNRHCHRCTDPCRYAMTLHLGRPFERDFETCVPL